MSDSPLQRRTYLTAAGTALTLVVAGCTSGTAPEEPTDAPDSDDTEPSEPEEPTEPSDSDDESDDPDGEECELTGRISEDTTLGGDCTQYLVTRSVSVDDGATLTIDPGVTIFFEGDTSLTITRTGALIAAGTEEAPITFTGSQERPGYWMGIEFQESGDTTNELSHAIIEYGGGPTQRRAAAAVRLEGTSSSRSYLTMSNTTLRTSDGYGIYVDPWSILEGFDANTLTENALGAAYVHSASADGLEESTTYAGNDRDVVVIEGNRIDDDVTVRWQGIDADYLVEGTTTVYGHLVVDPGATLVFRQDAAIDVRSGVGGLTAEGTAEHPITFTGEQATPGYWRGLGFVDSNSTDNVLGHAVVEHGGSTEFYGGSAGGPPANVTVTTSGAARTSRLALSDVELRDSDGHCLFANDHAVVDATRVTTSGCEESFGLN